MKILYNTTKTLTISVMLVWLVLILGSLTWNISQDYNSHYKNLLEEGRAFFTQIQTDRRWNAGTGGVYVPVSDRIKPNKYLDLPNRDIEDSSGKKYTMVNPAYMTRLISDLASEQREGIHFHITSLRPLNKEDNQPDEWETTALKSFEKGAKEKFEISEESGQHYFQYMAPLEVKKACLKCHEKQGYKLGDIRGCIRVKIPIEGKLLDFYPIFISYILILLLGEIAILFTGNRLGLKQENLNKAKEEAEEAAKAKARFLASMSHEIRTPMNGVIGMAELLEYTDINQEQADYLNTIKVSGETLLAIINDILLFSKMESDKLELEEETFNLRSCIEDIFSMLAGKASEKQVELLYIMEKAVPEFIESDIIRLRQILINLINNGLKFTPKGEILITVKNLTPVSENRISLQFEVKDTGIGIPENRKHRLFQAFSQVDASTTRKYGGTGLGLAISKKLVEAMEGEIWVESEEGEGATFYFTIQTYRSEADDKKNAVERIPELEGVKVLIVDDNRTNRKILSKNCLNWGMVPEDVSSAKEALAVISDNSKEFNLILSDLNMPEMDGVEMASKIREDYPKGKLPIILLSSIKAPEEKISLFNAVMQKPLRQSKLFETVCHVLSGTEVIKVVEEKNLETQNVCNILVAEDNPINQKLITKLLEKMGHTVTIASSGLKVVELLGIDDENSNGEIPYDLIFMDCQMPDMDGYETTTKIRKWEEKNSIEDKCPIIAMTAMAMSGDKTNCLNSGMDDYISKPIDIENVKKVIKHFT